MAETETINPMVEYADDKKDPQNITVVKVDIDGLQTKTIGKGAANAVIKFEKTERSFSLTVDLQKRGKKDVIKYKYEIKKLPADINTDKTDYKVKKDEIQINLYKASPGSWARYLSSVGLEHESEPAS